MAPEIPAHYLRILGLPNNPDSAEIKRAYYQAARANHPDLFPDGERQKRELVMMRINEAYMALTAFLCGQEKNSEPRPVRSPSAAAPPLSAEKLPGPLKNPDYVYYKRGIENYRAGQRRFFDRKNAAGRPQHFVPDSQLLSLAISALRHFQKAYACFYQVVSEYPDSIWVRDSKFHLWRLEQYNRVYTRICRQLASRVAAKEGKPEEPGLAEPGMEG
ncbi:DnaJ domain-containing protein [Marispirochaeta sp.]|jgi:hypothetical protein|uniref:DnaJ domain-containing protein n=1 Tax=Marispirochaeta sp. TaxID=2038653 RepID=UPI0029C6C59C|nr:DnaJ domain-containing protein [Marispirochaeta sp.]